MRILIAEDERITRVSLARRLEGWGHSVVSAEDGEQALEKFGAGEFDIVITDWEMPGLTGPELVQRIRGSGSASYVYVIMLTGRSDKSDIVKGIEAGADDFVSKPFDKEELRVRILAGERIVRLERTLTLQNDELREAGERMRRDLEAAARVQRAMLPSEDIVTDRVRTAWKYVPTDALAGDAIGLSLISERYLVAYVADVSGHGVPAALLSVTAMHALAPEPADISLIRDMSGAGTIGTVRRPALVASEINRRFRSEDSDGLFLTMILCVLDTHTGKLHFTRAGHPPPIVLRRKHSVEVDDVGGLPIAVLDQSEYEDVEFQLQPGDRVCLVTDGLFEEFNAAEKEQFSMPRLISMLEELHECPASEAVERTVQTLSDWAGGDTFGDDVSIVIIDWTPQA